MDRVISDPERRGNAALKPILMMGVVSLSLILWLLIAVMAMAVMMSFTLLHLSVDLSSNPSLVAIATAYGGAAWFYKRVRRDASIADPMEAVGQLFLVLLCGLLLTYAATAAGWAYRDAELYAIDQWMGFSRQAYRGFVSSIPALPDILDTAYLTIQPQTALIPFALVVTRRLQRLQLFILALGLALMMTSVVAVFVPAISAGIYIDLAPLRQAAIPAGVYTHLPTLEALRSGAMTVIQLNNLEGLVTFPSFHTANAILFAWALWTVPYLRWVGFVMNGLMILSTPLTGAHYIIDVVAGTIVAVAAIAFARFVGRVHGGGRARVSRGAERSGCIQVAASPPL